MAAMFASRKHIAALVLFYQNNEKPIYLDDFNAVTWATTLAKENERSMRDSHGSKVSYIYQPFTQEEINAAPVLTPVNCLKQCQFLDFQSCEAFSYYESQAWRTLHRIEGCAIAALPEYDSYPWGLKD
jgi:hypothetical protein